MRRTVSLLLALVLCPALSLTLFCAAAEGRPGGLYGYAPFTPWRRPPVVVPRPRPLSYEQLVQRGLAQTRRFARGRWYCEYLHCTGGPYPLATIWGSVPLFEALDGLAIANPTPAHLKAVDRIARYALRFYDRAVGGYAPYPGDRGRNVEVWFDDNGWLGIAFLNAYRATHEQRWLAAAQRAFRYTANEGWDRAAGGGMWWNTDHPYHSGPALASDSLLGALLYEEDHEKWQLEAVTEWVNWANANDRNDERRLYLEEPNMPESVIDYVQSPLIYTQYLLCKDGQGAQYCTEAGRLAATMAEQRVNKTEYRFNYGPEYDTIYLQWMMAYGQATGEHYWLKLAQSNAAAAARNARGADGLWLSSWWGGPIPDPETHPFMLRTVASTTSLFAWVDAYNSDHAAQAITPVAVGAPTSASRVRR